MKLLLCKEDLWTIIDGTEVEPGADADEKVKQRFRSRNNKAFGLIGLAIEDRLKEHIIDSNDAVSI